MQPYSILGSLFLGSSLARVISDFAISKFGINFFSSEFSAKIPFFSDELAGAKSYDVVNFALFALFSLFFFSVNLGALKVFKERERNLIGFIYLIFTFFIFLQTHFVNYSGKLTILLIIVIQAIYFIGHAAGSKKKLGVKGVILANGFFAGFYLLLITNNLTTSVAIPLGLLITMPIFYALSEDRAGRFVLTPAHLLLIPAFIFPFNMTYLIIVGLVSAVVGYLVKEKDFKSRKWLLNFLYPLGVLFIFAYNPLFYFGTFDSIEEGFWLGWLERLLNGEKLYADVAVWHPPLISWGLYLFTKAFGASIYHFRLYLHILQIVGIFIIFSILDKLLDKPLIKILVLWLILSFTTIGVRNNVEIRLGMGLLALLPVYFYMKSKVDKPHLLGLSGVLSSISLFTSFEIGVSAIISLALSVVFFLRGRTSAVQRLYFYFVGVVLGALPFIVILWSQGAIDNFVKQMFFYSKAFSSGYLNIPIERSKNLTLLEWRVVDRYLGSSPWYWEMARMGLLGVAMFLLYKFSKGLVNTKDRFAAILMTFVFFLFRPVLARSDIYHLLLVLIISVIFIAYLAEEFSKKAKGVGIFVLLLIALFFARGATQQGFLHSQLIKFQTYGNPAGSYPSYELDRARIITNIDVDTKEMDDLVSFIDNQTSREDAIFVYPWMPEVYFLSSRKNATSFDTPLAFFTEEYQTKMVNELESQKPKLVIYNSKMSLSGLTTESLPVVNKYIEENFTSIETFGDIQVLTPNI